jgi:hypothetical protein
LLKTKPTYLANRLAEIGISEADNATTLLRFNENEETYKEAKEVDAKWFDTTPGDDIRILFKTLTGRQMQLHAGTNKNVSETYRIRLHPDTMAGNIRLDSKNSGKYRQPPGTGAIVYHTQGIIDAYNHKTKVPTLYLVEGEFKAYVAWHRSMSFIPNAKQKAAHKELLFPKTGMPIMGMTGIWNFKGDDGEMHDDIRRFCQVCQVQNIVVIYDRDLYDLPKNYDPTDEAHQEKDIGQRISNFCTAALQFKEMYKGMVSDIYLVPLNPNAHKDDFGDYKGLDDLLVAAEAVPGAVSNIIYELIKSPADGARSKHIVTHNLVAKTTLETKKFFKQKASEFYDYHVLVLDGHTFKFQRGLYQISDNGKLEQKAHPDSFVYARVETNWYKIIRKPDNRGNQVRQISKTSVGNLTLDYVKKGYPQFLQTIETYDDFINIAENDPDKYKRRIVSTDDTSSFYNMYEPISHRPEVGEWKYIRDFLNHIFGEQYIHALDYLYMTYLHPAIKMPVICLVSREGGTGKTTFLKFLKDIFQENVAIIGNAELGDRFNDDYAARLIIAVDEGMVEKGETIEKIKQWATADYINMDKKNASRVPMEFIGHILMTSNHPDTFMRISEFEERFWVRHVPVATKSLPNLRELMQLEIPAFLNYLKNEHKLNTEHSHSRFYFNMKDLETAALNKLKDRSQSQLIRNFKLHMRDLFIEYNSHPESDDFSTLYLTLKEVREADAMWAKLDIAYIKDQLELAEFRYISKTKNCKVPEKMQLMDESTDLLAYTSAYKAKRCFVFHIAEFLTEEEITNIKINLIAPGSDLPF